MGSKYRTVLLPRPIIVFAVTAARSSSPPKTLLLEEVPHLLARTKHWPCWMPLSGALVERHEVLTHLTRQRTSVHHEDYSATQVAILYPIVTVRSWLAHPPHRPLGAHPRIVPTTFSRFYIHRWTGHVVPRVAFHSFYCVKNSDRFLFGHGILVACTAVIAPW